MSSETQGYFLAVDGGNGAGKSTVLNALVDHLSAQGFDLVLTREPGGTEIGEKIRALILDPSHEALCASAELLLFAAARAQHYHEKIKPALEAGKLVISDRFSAATVAFQGYAQGKDLASIHAANALAIGGFQPDMNLILDLDPVIGMQRMQGRAALDRHELQALDFHQRARQGYLDQAVQDPERFTLIDASQTPEAVLARAISAVQAALEHAGFTPRRTFLRSQESCG